jgi:hypothetical protein
MSRASAARSAAGAGVALFEAKLSLSPALATGESCNTWLLMANEVQQSQRRLVLLGCSRIERDGAYQAKNDFIKQIKDHRMPPTGPEILSCKISSFFNCSILVSCCGQITETNQARLFTDEHTAVHCRANRGRHHASKS